MITGPKPPSPMGGDLNDMSKVPPTGLMKLPSHSMNPNSMLSISTFVGSEDEPEQATEQVLKKKREKLAQDKLGIQPELDLSV